MNTPEINNLNEAEQYHLKAQFVLNELQANKQVYGSNSALTGATPANVDLALKYINRSLEMFPTNAVYLNLKALLLWEGKGNKDDATALLEQAAKINPKDIDIQNNLEAIKSSSCFIATAAFGSPLTKEVDAFRDWRDSTLLQTFLGKGFVNVYYFISPPMAKFISKHAGVRHLTRGLLVFLLKRIKN